VLSVPGPRSTVDGAIRRYLRELGYDSYAWKMGRISAASLRLRATLRESLAEIHASRAQVSVVG